MTSKDRTSTQRKVAPPEPTSEELHANAVRNDEKRIRGHSLAEYVCVVLIITSSVATFFVGRYILTDAAQLPATVAWSIIILCACVPAGLVMQALHSDTTKSLIENRINLSGMVLDLIQVVKIGMHQYFSEHMKDYNAESGEIDMAQELYRGISVKNSRIEEIKHLTLKGLAELGLKGPLQEIIDVPARARMVTEMVKMQIRRYEELPADAELKTELDNLSSSLRALEIARNLNGAKRPAE